MPAIEKLIIKGFKAFPGDFELKFEGKHLLMYGENGSGKSSIYSALNVLYNLHKRNGRYKSTFDINNPANSINKNKTLAESSVGAIETGDDEVFVNNSGHIYTTETMYSNKNGFINHYFLSNFYTNTQYRHINIFNIFLFDLLQYEYNDEYDMFLSEMYNSFSGYLRDNLTPKKKTLERIDVFNNSLTKITEEINLLCSDIYNDHLKLESDPKLQIKLQYLKDNDSPEEYLNGYWLKYDRLLFRNSGAEIEVMPKNGYNKPFIRLEVMEQYEDSYRKIIRPDLYFNEAKLTAVALSVRFSLLDLTSSENGRFLALDDMLISLDMSNRTKVIDFLLSISDKYKIYLFTHNRAFFELVKEKIDIKNDKGNWIYKELYQNDDVKKNPICLDSGDSYTRAMAHFHKCDFPAAANYLRKSVEELMSMMPPYISKKDDGSVAEKLRTKVDATKCLLQRLDGDVSDINEIVSALNLLLNPLSHRSIDTDVYRVDLKKVFEVIPRLKAHIKELDIKEVVAKTKHVFLTVQENATTKCEIEIELTEAIYSFLNEAGARVLSSAKGNSIQSKTIKDGEDPDTKPHKYNTGTLEETCNAIHRMCGKSYTCSYWDFYTDENKLAITSL